MRIRHFRFSIILLLIAALTLSTQFFSSQAAKGSRPRTHQRQEVTQESRVADRELAATIRQLANRSTDGLVEEQLPNGSYLLDLKGRFQNVSLAKINPDGKISVGCVTSLGEANTFFGRNLETGEVYPVPALPDETTTQAAAYGMSPEELHFYQSLIAEAAARRVNPENVTITISNADGAGEGFNDPTAKAPEGGNNGTTLGQQRLNLFNQAALIWGAFLDSGIPITINSQFNPLTPCSPGGGVLGQAGAATFLRDFPNAGFTNTFYHIALANKQTGGDLNGVGPEINATFNSSVDTGCLGAGTRFYYGFDNSTPSGTINLLVVLLHEFGHGLGSSSLVGSDGSYGGQSVPDIWARFMFDRTLSLTWFNMTQGQRATSTLNTGNVLWDGANVRIASGFLTAGRDAATGRVQMYMPNPFEPGSSVSHFDTACNPNLLMEPAINTGLPLTLDLTRQQMRDIGWYRDSNTDLVADTITNVQPSGGTVTVGSNVNITWTNNGGFNRNVTIELSTDGGTTFPLTIASDVTNTGTRSWTVPNNPTTQARVRVREHDFVAPLGSSSANFTISNVVNSPPTITAGAAVTRQQGSAGSTATIATVTDDAGNGTVGVTATTVPTGITVTGITNSNGTITATVTAGCTAAVGNNTVVL
ncbi:MAG: hypothetical protein K1Y36_22695, partial [Blastocatellia bacterium]|nr:hypothetical protein [Blastocatellia bacterium]